MAGNDDKIREPDVNKLIGSFLHSGLTGWTIITEQENVIKENPEWRPDILVFRQGGDSAMVIECEFEPANDVVQEATRHLGKSLNGCKLSVKFVIALVLPESLKDPEEYCVETATYKINIFGESLGPGGKTESGDLACLASVICEFI